MVTLAASLLLMSTAADLPKVAGLNPAAAGLPKFINVRSTDTRQLDFVEQGRTAVAYGVDSGLVPTETARDVSDCVMRLMDSILDAVTPEQAKAMLVDGGSVPYSSLPLTLREQFKRDFLSSVDHLPVGAAVKLTIQPVIKITPEGGSPYNLIPSWGRYPGKPVARPSLAARPMFAHRPDWSDTFTGKVEANRTRTLQGWADEIREKTGTRLMIDKQARNWPIRIEAPEGEISAGVAMTGLASAADLYWRPVNDGYYLTASPSDPVAFAQKKQEEENRRVYQRVVRAITEAGRISFEEAPLFAKPQKELDLALVRSLAKDQHDVLKMLDAPKPPKCSAFVSLVIDIVDGRGSSTGIGSAFSAND